MEGENNPSSAPPSAGPSPIEPITWTGSEYLDRHKNTGWYLGLAGFIALVCAVVYIIGRDLLSVGFIALMGILFAIIAGRKPRQLAYAIDDQGLHIGQKSFGFNEFKSFSLQREGAIGYISLLPLRRFQPELTIYYAPEDEQRIFEALALRIPHEDHKETLIDKLIRLIRF